MSLGLSVAAISTLAWQGAAEIALPGPGNEHVLTDGRLFIPPHLKPGTENLDLTLHLHGAATVVWTNFLAAAQPGVLVVVTLPGLSAAYAAKFRDPKVFWRILEESAERLSRAGKVPRWRRITVSSFSAGYGGVRELLKHEDIYPRLAALVMADSIYAGLVGEPEQRQVDPAHMEGFLRFARDAARDTKYLLISHTQLQTVPYASTGETAHYLLTKLGAVSQAVNQTWGGGLKLLSHHHQGHLEILGFEGTTGEDHLRHLRNLGLFLARTQETTPPPPTPPPPQAK